MTENMQQDQPEACKDCPPEGKAKKTNNSMYFAVIAFMALVGLSVAYTFIISGPSDVLQPAAKTPGIDAQAVSVKLEGFRYSPDPVQVKAGTPIKFTVTRTDEEGCGNAISFYSLGKSAALPKGQAVTFDLPAMQAGQTLDFGCSMRMVTGQIVAA
ncbi:cupredoxin domain-containing protein [Candidatus Micrarchaeota archaeon]|nr:cupredoxin domain-containing protein [Candidatus Micrarchaeota archaeon]